MQIERHPYQSRPGFDCRNDNANCPGCKGPRKGDHGVSGGAAFFTVKTTVDGQRYAVSLEVLTRNYPPTVDRSAWRDDDARPMGATLCFHVAKDGGEPCEYVGGTCEFEPLTYTGAAELWDAYGDATGGPEQSDAFWNVLGSWLERMVARHRRESAS